jgi:hypothetical protein
VIETQTGGELVKKDMYVIDWKPKADAAAAAGGAQPQRERLIYAIDRNQLGEQIGKAISFEDPDPIVAPLLPLIEQNIAFAAIPENFGEGSACYLINLTSLK